jgi:hypothetical protein
MPPRRLISMVWEGVAGLIAAAEFGNPKLDVVGGHAGCGEGELVAEPATCAFADDDRRPLARRGLECVQQAAGLRAAVPGNGAGLADVEVLLDDLAAQGFDEPARVTELPAAGRRRVLLVFC